MKKILNNQSGFGFVELLVSVSIMTVLMIGVYNLINIYLRLNSDNASLIAATEIANQKMEQIRNLPYANVGTIAGSPSGSIPQTEIVSQEGTYQVDTKIKYFLDPYDGLVPPTDPIFDDYKIVTITVSWQGKYKAQSITLFSKVIPRTMETDSGNGLLLINVVDANGNPVGGANVHIENTLVGGDYVNTDETTNASGTAYLSAKPAFEDYRLSVTKAGYGTDRTYDRTVDNPNPTRPHLSLTLGDKTEETFQIDLLSILHIETITQDLPSNWEVKNDVSGEAQTNSRLVFDNLGFVYIVWQDYCCSADSKIHAQKYDDTGNSQWTEQVIGTTNNTVLPDIQVDLSGNLYLAWSDDSVGNKESYLISLNSSDGSDRWGGEKKINTTWNSDRTSPRIAMLDSLGTATTSIVWVDNWHGDYDIFLQFYNQSGLPILAFDEDAKVNDTVSGDGTNQIEPEIVSNSSDEVYVTWTDDQNGNLDIYIAKFDSKGTYLWSPSNQLANTDGGVSSQYESDVDVDSSGNIYVVWTDERNGDKDVYAQKYDSDGNAIWGADLRINTSLDTADQYEPSIAVDNSDNFYVTWTDERNDNQDIFSQKYNGAGSSLWPTDIRININPDNSNQYKSEVVINPVSNTPYATWIDERGGDADIYITEFGAYGASSSLSSVPITVTGTKKIGENPIIYEYDVATSSDLSGIKDLLVEWDSPGYTVAATPTALSLIFVEPTLPVVVLPGMTVDIIMYLQ